MSFKQKVWINGPPMISAIDSAVREAAIDRAAELGVVGIRAAVPGWEWFKGDGSAPNTSILTDYIDYVKSKSLGLHIIIFPELLCTTYWRNLGGFLQCWGDDKANPPNQYRPPNGFSNAIWNRMIQDLQTLIYTAHNRWGSLNLSPLTFEFCNEVATDGAFGMKTKDENGNATDVWAHVGGNWVKLEPGMVDDEFHIMAQYFLVDAIAPLDFYDRRVFAPATVGFKDTTALQTQMDTLFGGSYSYRVDAFDAWSMNIYPRIEGYHMTGHVACANDANERALQQLDRLRAITEVGAKPIAIQETGVSGYIGGFTESTESNNPIFGRPFYLQEMGRYLGATVVSLCSLGVERVTAFSLYSNYESADNAYGGEAGYSLTRRVSSSSEEDHYRASLLWFASFMDVTYSAADPPGIFEWDVNDDASEVTIQPY